MGALGLRAVQHRLHLRAANCSLEEYYALAVIRQAGLGTPHMDGNTRLCTATAAAALK